jgi:glycosyltransferase involved in cell wall biosynthesis
MTRGRVVHFIVPDGLDDPERVSGGNVYDRRIREGLTAAGWIVARSEAADDDAVAKSLSRVPVGGTVLVDGLVAAWNPDAIEQAAARSRLVVLAHMIVDTFSGADAARADRERQALGHAAAVIATSNWTASELVRRGTVDESRVTVAVPGSVAGPIARGEAGELLCVGAVAAHKGQDILLSALGALRGLDWTCTIVGSRDTDPEFAGRVASTAATFGSRVRMTGVLHPDALANAYQRSGLLIAPSRTESFGMAIADAGGRALPVTAAAVGGIPEAVAGGGALLVNPDDPAALADALSRWMTDPALRARLRDEAVQARRRAPRWNDTVAQVERVLVAP